MKEKMRAEAIERMKILNLHPNVLNEFKNENKINFSEFNLGILYWADFTTINTNKKRKEYKT